MVTATLLYVDVFVVNHVPVDTVQVDGSNSGVRLFAAGTGMLHGCCQFRVPKKHRAGLLVNQVTNAKNYIERVSILCKSIAGSFTVRQLNLLD